MTAKDSRTSHPPAAQSAVALNCLHGIFGARRHKPAGRRKHGRDGPLISPQQLQHDEFGDVAQERLPGFGLRLSAVSTVADRESAFPESFCSITTKARLTSFTTAVKSAVSKDFFGLITTSAAAPAGGSVMRTASRRRRFMRLRWTAPPNARPTVNPTRSPCAAGALIFVSCASAAVSGRGQ